MKLLTLLFLLGLSGCMTAPPPALSPFERCINTLRGEVQYQGDLIRMADWCKTNNNGDIQ